MPPVSAAQASLRCSCSPTAVLRQAVFFLVLFILVARVALHKDAFESFVFAVALAVGLTPEFLPMITSVTLARGSVRMARAQVVVKHLPAIQNFGSIDVLCSDNVRAILDAKGSAAPEGSEKSVRNRMFFRVIRLFACAVVMAPL
jgi:high-affinity K+ transport system ATPase subunit B